VVKQAVILAGGRGTRLAVAFPGVPKPLVPVAGIPLAERLVRQLVEQGIERITLTVFHDAERIRTHFGDGSSFLCQIDYLLEPAPMGSAGILHQMASRTNETVLVVYGDVLADIDWQRFAQFHHQLQADATLLVHPNDHPHDSDLVELDGDQRVLAVLSKPHPPGRMARNLVNAGAYLFEPVCWKHIPSDRPVDFGGDLLPHWCSFLRVFGYNTPEYIKDMGTPERIVQGEAALASGKVAARSLQNVQAAIFLDRDGVLNEDTDLIHRPEDLHLFPWTSEAVRLINRSSFLSVVVTNQSVVARGLTDEAGLNRIHAKLDTELGTASAYLDALYYCPHHPDGGFPGEVAAYKIPCTCRKPQAGMLLAAAERFQINLSASWMVGDSARDMGAALAAGVEPVGVRTGHGLKGSAIRPDFLFDNLLDAVHYIVEQPFTDLFNEGLERLKNQITVSKKPFVIALGGPARSGKSTAAAGLARAFRQKGYTVELVRLDDWLLPAEQRNQSEIGQWRAYPQEALNAALHHLLVEGKTITAPGYSVRPDWPARETHCAPADVVLVEGVVALGLESVRQAAHWTIGVTAPESTRRLRYERYQTWRGLPADEAEWARREQHEVAAVEKDLIFVQTLVSL
jgi:D,D-heptose 1,7-bisphosphate phosphatase